MPAASAHLGSMRMSLLATPYGEPLWEDGPDGGEPTDYGIEVYTEGDCWALAWHVALLTGGTLNTLGRWPAWNHVVVEVGPDRYLDALGIHTAAELRAEWDGRVCQMDSADVATLADYTEVLMADFMYLSGHGEAADFARRLVAKYLGHALAA